MVNRIELTINDVDDVSAASRGNEGKDHSDERSGDGDRKHIGAINDPTRNHPGYDVPLSVEFGSEILDSVDEECPILPGGRGGQ